MTNMIKFYRLKKLANKEIRQAWLVKETENGYEKVKVLGIIGKVADLLSLDLISVEYGEAEMDRYLSITLNGCIIDVSDTLQDAANKFKLWYTA